MTPIHEVLHRILWDPGCRESEFEIGYLDRVAGHVRRLPFRNARLAHTGRPVLETVGEDGTPLTIPLHRIREVWRDGTRIWQRPPVP